MKKYRKPRILAKNRPTGSFAAGCPTKTHDGTNSKCKACEIKGV